MNDATLAPPEPMLTRHFAAPPALLWAAWTEPRHVERWFGPHGYATQVVELDPRVGGRWRYIMRGPDGRDIHFGGHFTEVTPHRRLVMTDRFEDADGAPVPASHYGLPDAFPPELTIAVTFEEVDGGTRVRLDQSIPPELWEATGVVAGWSESFEKLDRLLADQA